MATAFTVEMGEELYSIVAPDGTPGDEVPYEVPATIFWKNVLYYALVNDPDEFPEGGPAPTVFRVDATTVMESVMEEVSDEEEGPDGGDQEEEEEEEEEDEQEPGSGGEVIDFPVPEEEEDDENLPPAEQG